MATINRIIEMQQQGMSDGDIISSLQNEGISPKEINDSLSQARIKMAVSQDTTEGYEESAPQQMEQPGEQYTEYPESPQSQEYGQQGSYPEQGQMNIDTISEIVDRIVSEKTREISSKIKAVSDFKSKTEEEIGELKDRIKRIESSTDNLQKAVITKIGEIGQSNTLVHKDLENLHGTVSKLMNPLIDNYNELKKHNSSKK